MCTSEGKLFAGESFNPDSVDGEVLYAMEDDELVFNRRKNRKKYIVEDDVTAPSCEYFETNASDPFAFEERFLEKIDLSLSSHGSNVVDAYTDKLPVIITIQPVKRLKRKRVAEHSVASDVIVATPAIHSFVKEPVAKERTHRTHREERFWWKEMVHERIRSMRKMSLSERFVVV